MICIKKRRKRREEKRKRKEGDRDDSEPASKAQIIEKENPGKRKAEDSGEAQTENDGDVVINQITMDWVHEVNSAMVEEEEEEEEVGAWDDVHGGALPKEMVEEARKEEIGIMQGRNIWSLKPIEDCWRGTAKAPLTVRWVDTNKGGETGVFDSKSTGCNGFQR